MDTTDDDTTPDAGAELKGLRLHVPKDNAVEQGFLARLRGEPADACPFRTAGPAERWHQGWELDSEVSGLPAASAPMVERAELRLDRWRFGAEILLAVTAVVSVVLLGWELRNTRTQLKLQRTQIDRQQADTLIVRRAQLLDTIYTEECEDLENTGEEKERAQGEQGERTTAPAEPICKPKANPRAVQEAVLAFVEIERGRGAKADLGGAVLLKANLRGADLSEAILREAVLLKADLRGADLSEAILRGAVLRGANLGGANLGGALLGGADLGGAYLPGANLRGAYLWKADLGAALLVRAILREAYLQGAVLSEANLSAADLTAADLNEAYLRGAILLDADLRGAVLRRADGLTREQLAAACGDAETKLPEGLEMPDTWPCRLERNESGKMFRVPLDPGAG